MSSSSDQSYALYQAYVDKDLKEIDRHIALGTKLPERTVMGEYGHFEFGYNVTNFLKEGHLKQFRYALNCNNFSFDSSHEINSLISDAISTNQYDIALEVINHPKVSIGDRGRRKILEVLATHLVEKDKYHGSQHQKLYDHVTDKDPKFIEHFNYHCFDIACTNEKTALAKKLAQDSYRLDASTARQIQIEAYCSKQAPTPSNPDKQDYELLDLLLKHISWDRFSQNAFLDKAIINKRDTILHAFIDSGNNKILNSDKRIQTMHYALINKDQKTADCVISQILNSSNLNASVPIEVAAFAFDAIDMLPDKLKERFISEKRAAREQATLVQSAFHLAVEDWQMPRANAIFNQNKDLISFSGSDWATLCEKALEQGQTNLSKNLLSHGPRNFDYASKASLSCLMTKIGRYVEEDRQAELFEALYDTMSRHDISEPQDYVHRAIVSALHDEQPFTYMLSKADGIAEKDWERDFYWSSDVRKTMRKTPSPDIKALLEKSAFIPSAVAKTVMERDDIVLLTYLSEHKSDLVPHDDLLEAYCTNIIKEDSPQRSAILKNMVANLPETEEVQKAKGKAIYEKIYDDRHDSNGLISTIKKLEDAVGLPKDYLESYRKASDESFYFDSDTICLAYQLTSCASKQYKAATYLIEQGCPFHFQAVREVIRKSYKSEDTNALLSAMANSPYNDVITDKADQIFYLITHSELTAEQIDTLLDTQVLEHTESTDDLESLYNTLLVVEEDEYAYGSGPNTIRPSKRVKERLDYLNDSKEIHANISEIYDLHDNNNNTNSEDACPAVKAHLSDAFAQVFAKTTMANKAFMTENDNPKTKREEAKREAQALKAKRKRNFLW